jgi:RNA polymerase sigma factor for flagellar operon FliA
MAMASGFGMYNEVQVVSLEKLVEQHALLVKRIAHHLVARLPSSVQVDDLIQSGMIGLFEAAKKYDASKGASFETYAGIRIRGAMLDEVRKGDWVPRSVHRNSRRVSEAISHVENRTGRDAKDFEVAQELNMSLDEYHTILQDTAGSRLFSFDGLLDPDEAMSEAGGSSPSPLEGIAQDALHQSLTDAIRSLPQREQLVLSLYYDEELNLKEIGDILGVSESRVSQIHSQTALRLRARLQDWRDKIID